MKPTSMRAIMAKCHPVCPLPMILASDGYSARPCKLCENAGRFIVNAFWRCTVLVTHYSTNGLDSACGRSSQTLVSTVVADDVSCKSCQRSLAKPDTAAAVRKSPSLAELRKSAKAVAEPAAAPVEPAAVAAKSAAKPAAKPAANTPARAGGFSVKAAWAARLAEQNDRCRLPRGKAKQSHV